jgi:hypothetical protein
VQDAVDHGVGVAIRSSVDTIMIRLRGKNFLVPRTSMVTAVYKSLDTSVKTIVMMDVVVTVLSANL